MDIYRYTENLSLFVEIARCGSFSAVARRHGVNPSSVARKIDMLESVMKAPLFTRSTRGIHLTETGSALFTRAVGVLEALNDMRDEIVSLNEDVSGTLRLSCLPTFAKLHILPWLPEFKSHYPDMDLVLDLTEQPEIPSNERLDAVIRIGKLRNSSLYATKIARQTWVACASPCYIAQYGAPGGPADLANHPILDKYHDPYSISWRRIINTQGGDYRLYLRCNDYGALLEAALSGLGIVFLPNWVAGRDIKAGRLIKLFDDPQNKVDDIYFLRTLPGLTPKLTAFLQFLRNNLKAAL